MSDKIELSASAKGSRGEDEDWWRLVIEDDGKMYIEHEWSHLNAYKFRVGNSGKNHIAVSHFLSDDYNPKAQQKLRAELDRRKGTSQP
jgi:hypothetical protein